MSDLGWFQDGRYIVESAWGRFQDTPIFRALARQHNVTVTKHQMIDAIADGGYVESAQLVATGRLYGGEWVFSKVDPLKGMD